MTDIRELVQNASINHARRASAKARGEEYVSVEEDRAKNKVRDAKAAKSEAKAAAKASLDAAAEQKKLAETKAATAAANVVSDAPEVTVDANEEGDGVFSIESASKDELEAYARENFNVELDKRKALKTLRKQVSGLEG